MRDEFVKKTRGIFSSQVLIIRDENFSESPREMDIIEMDGE